MKINNYLIINNVINVKKYNINNINFNLLNIKIKIILIVKNVIYYYNKQL